VSILDDAEDGIPRLNDVIFENV